MTEPPIPRAPALALGDKENEGPAARSTENAIPITQSSQPFLDLLAARGNRYHIALNWWTLQFTLAVVAPVLLTLLQIIQPAMKPWVSAYAVAAILLFEPWFDHLQERRREEAARVQEWFDRQLYGLPWPEASLGEPPSESDINVWAKREKRRVSPLKMAQWIDWYPVIAGHVPLAVARLICQRANGWWDARQRERLAELLRLGGLALAAALVVIGVAFDQRISGLVEQLLVVAPLVSWSAREAYRHDKTRQGRDRVMERASAILRQQLTGDRPESVLTAEAMDLQRDIFEQRRDGALVPNWIYAMFRSEQEPAMQHAAETFVAEYHAAQQSGRIG